VLKVEFTKDMTIAYRILCLGAHCDDIEIGCGGTILKFLNRYHDVKVDWIVFSSNAQRADEAYNSAYCFLAEAKFKNIVIKRFRDGFLPFKGSVIKNYFEKLKSDITPDLIFTHYRHDLHQDHRFISELTWNTFRDHCIFEYEIPKYDGDLGSPNFFVHLDEPTVQSKVQSILENFKSQTSKKWFGEDTFFSILRIRGMESNAPSKYAEGFYCRKIVF
jgi:LmbE family N-acetylglucosaminyl deacetylase